ncbi:hypothetical protein [Paenibacillus chibensis]|uniref:hypothetical protein n=1 Tax=Paenibacillus chibensis TaxID=59846 RepID=UPI000FD93790|nr:hypothetical protein [Paenibacillus chibensis]MEC0373416.1 hypothetical protein [Paenibacillus chibensis]
MDEKRVTNIKKLLLLLAVMFSITALISCSIEDKKINNPTSIANEYPGNIQDINKIELIDGKTGESKTITKKDEITNILNVIKDEKLIPSDNQEGGVGYIFRVKLFENEELIIDFTPNRLKSVEYKSNAQLIKTLKGIYKDYFEREF